ncbi:glycosyltransferase family 87 protein [Rubrobacter indicoceani]|uniref:glycosyltransferase family 87 protein n=1 Tax=Rubrobacter indicoceani TaxID=2051957 RepID=UPI000E5B98CC|nr:glycosyltransferase family 87 protein [Rubrobacter indicoceani]
MKGFLRVFSVLAVVLLLGVMLGVEGPQLSEGRAVSGAGAALAGSLEPGRAEGSARYDAPTDTWRVVFTVRDSGETVGRAVVDDDSGEVDQARLDGGSSGEESGSGSPPGELDRDQATKLAAANPDVREELSGREYTTRAELENGVWTVRFYIEGTRPIGGVPQDNGTKEAARVELDADTWVVRTAYTGDAVGWNMARGVDGAYGKQANYWYVWGPMAAVFFLAFLRNDRLLSLRNLDLTVLTAGFLVAHHFFRIGESQLSVFLWYPPLLYLFVRCILLGFGIGERVGRTSNFPTWLLLAFAGLAGGLVLALNTDSRVIDVGYAGVVGGQLILDGAIPYGNMPDSVGTGDTYGPLNYLLYVPFILMFGFSGEWDFLPAAHALTSFSFVAGAFAMFFSGWKFSGVRAGAALAFAWCAFPYTLYAANNNTNDIVVASAAAIGLVFASSPLARGVAIGAGFAIKLYPVILGPLWLLYDGFRKRSIVDFFLGGATILLMTFWVLLLGGNPVEAARIFYERTLAFQGDRVTPWTIYTQLPQVEFLQTPVTILIGALALAVALVPRKRTIRRLAAFSGALVIGFQLTVNYWYFGYVVWFEPFVFLALLLATDEKTELDGAPGVETVKDGDPTEGNLPSSSRQGGNPRV